MQLAIAVSTDTSFIYAYFKSSLCEIDLLRHMHCMCCGRREGAGAGLVVSPEGYTVWTATEDRYM